MKINVFLPISIIALLGLSSCDAPDTANKPNNEQQALLKSTPQPSQANATFHQVKSETTSQPSELKNTSFDQVKLEKWTDTAKFLAGMQLGNNSPLAQSQNSNSWLKQRQYFENTWSKLETQQLKKVRQWSQQEVKQINDTSPSVFYPFSGPDFLYAYSFFPKGKEYILMGLEPVGKALDLTAASESDRNRKLEEVRSSLYAILQFSFFRTNDMKVDLQKQGVLPILYVFLARTQNRIIDVQNIGINKDGKIQVFEKGMISGVKIAFVPEGESQPRTLYYFSADLSNDGLKKRPELSQFISGIDNNITYLKAASYLMHNDSFSEIRRNILAQSKYVLQDDSGISLKAFDNSKWDLKFYGAYTNPISLFSGSYQEELRKVYSTSKSIKPLNFGIGYKVTANDSNLMLASKNN
jgi:hypothetical protein